jgi:hypothetical protein
MNNTVVLPMWATSKLGQPRNAPAKEAAARSICGAGSPWLMFERGLFLLGLLLSGWRK